MSGRPAPTRCDHRDFCRIEGWQERRGDHVRYSLPLPDGTTLFTRISHPVSRRDTYGPSLWRKILRDDLDVTEDEFWACVRDKVLPERDPAPTPATSSLPIGLARLLVDVVGLPPDEVARLSEAQAARRLADHYASTPPREEDPPPGPETHRH